MISLIAKANLILRFRDVLRKANLEPQVESEYQRIIRKLIAAWGLQ